MCRAQVRLSRKKERKQNGGAWRCGFAWEEAVLSLGNVLGEGQVRIARFQRIDKMSASGNQNQRDFGSEHSCKAGENNRQRSHEIPAKRPFTGSRNLLCDHRLSPRTADD